MRAKNNKGFTLAELLIVVAIIAVLVAIGIPIFTSQLEKSRESVDLSEVRSAYAEVMMAAITGDTNATYTKDSKQIIHQNDGSYKIIVTPLKQHQDGWQTALPITIGGVSSEMGEPKWIGVPKANGYCIITYHPATSSADEFTSFEWSGSSSAPEKPSPPSDDSSNSSNPSSPSGSKDDAWKDLNSNAIEYPKTGVIDIIQGNVYRENGVLYIAKIGKEKADVNWIAPTKPDNKYIFVQYSGTIYDVSDEYDTTEHKISNVEPGDIYRAADGTLYVCRVYSTHELTPMNDNYNKDNWTKINEELFLINQNLSLYQL